MGTDSRWIPRRGIRHRRDMTARRASGALVVAATVLSLLEAGLLPGPLDDLAGPSEASAQPPVVLASRVGGTPDACPIDPHLPNVWSPQPGDADYDTASECVLELPACPSSSFLWSDIDGSRGRLMRLSVAPIDIATRFPDLHGLYPDALSYPDELYSYPHLPDEPRFPEFCEERITNFDDPAREDWDQMVYAQCAALVGKAVFLVTDAGGLDVCQIIYPMRCPDGMHRSGRVSCRAVLRRSWNCDTSLGYIPANTFNTCYLPSSLAGLTVHPACGSAAPKFVIGDCADYVGTDFIQSLSTALGCVDAYLTHTPAEYSDGTQVLAGTPTVDLASNPRSGVSSDFWCSFDSRYLSPDCHRTDAASSNCPPASTMRLCLRRVSGTGGCDLIAKTIKCRAFEAAYSQKSATNTSAAARIAEELGLQGCTPCTNLPFEPEPSHCKLSTSTPPAHIHERLKKILRVKQDFSVDNSWLCGAAADPLQDHLVSSNACFSQPICADPPRGRLEWTSGHFSRRGVVNSPIIWRLLDLPDTVASREYLGHYYRTGDVLDHYRDSTLVHTGTTADRVTQFSPVDTATSYGRIENMVTHECKTRAESLFQLRIRELWPDDATDRAAITTLFGADSLLWWNNLTPQQQTDLTDARITDPMAAGLAADREDALTTNIACSLIDGKTCMWTPTRSGYFTVAGEGAWYSTITSTRKWGLNHTGTYFDRLHDHLTITASAEDGICPIAYSSWFSSDNPMRMKDRDCIRDDLMNLMRLTPADAGLLDDLSDILPAPTLESDYLYTDAMAELSRCQPLDFRVVCPFSGGTGNYTATEPIGIIIHEVRVVTVEPYS